MGDFHEHSIMVQNVSASLKAKINLNAYSCQLLQAQYMLLDQSAILDLGTAKF